jgi:hypothetical protein
LKIATKILIYYHRSETNFINKKIDVLYGKFDKLRSEKFAEMKERNVLEEYKVLDEISQLLIAKLDFIERHSIDAELESQTQSVIKQCLRVMDELEDLERILPVGMETFQRPQTIMSDLQRKVETLANKLPDSRDVKGLQKDVLMSQMRRNPKDQVEAEKVSREILDEIYQLVGSEAKNKPDVEATIKRNQQRILKLAYEYHNSEVLKLDFVQLDQESHSGFPTKVVQD